MIRDLCSVDGLKGCSFELAAGERLVLLGPTGSGKSTLLKLIVGLQTPTRGDVIWNGQSLLTLPAHRRGIAYLPQRPAFYPQWDVKRNLQITHDAVRKHHPVRPPDEVIQLVKIGPLLDRDPGTLSGGERQRVALARSLLLKAPLWLLDEPFAPLDPVFRSEFRRELLGMQESANATMILVSHDPHDSSLSGSQIGIMTSGVLSFYGSRHELGASLLPFANAFSGFISGIPE